MRTPPLLLGCALLFWGWETDYLAAGALMAVILEAARVVKVRREFSDEDLHRISLFCSLALLTAVAYAFTNNDGPAGLGSLLQNPSGLAAQNKASNATQEAALAVFRWSPMLFFLFVAAQTYGTREAIPVVTVWLWGWRERMRALKAGRPIPPGRTFNPTYPYFALCLVASSFHPDEQFFFWGLSLLATWALWPFRPKRFGLALWTVVMTLAVVLSYGGQRGVGRIEQLLVGYGSSWWEWRSGGSFDPAMSRTSLGQIGKLNGSGKIVIRLQAKTGEPPPLLREASYCLYKYTTWLSTAGPFESVNVESNGTSWLLLPEKTNAAAVTIASYLDGRKGLLPLPEGAWRLDNLDVFPLQTNSVGAVWAEGPGLVIFDARYGPGATIDSPPDTNMDLRVPLYETRALDQVVTEARLAGLNRAQTLQAVESFFSRNFTYSLWQKPPPRKGREESPLTRFLLETRSGHCEYFATATVLLLRQLGFPARYAVGYAVHESSGHGKYVVRSRDAHAWCLVWNPDKKVWEDFDTTPGSWINMEEKRASALQFLSDGWSWLWFEFSKVRWQLGDLRQYIFWILLPVLALLLFQIVRKSSRRNRKAASRKGADTVWPGLDSEFYALERKLAGLVGPRRADEPLAAWLQHAVGHAALVPARETLRELLALHYRHRFDPHGLPPDERAGLRQKVGNCLELLEPGSKR